MSCEDLMNRNTIRTKECEATVSMFQFSWKTCESLYRTSAAREGCETGLLRYLMPSNSPTLTIWSCSLLKDPVIVQCLNNCIDRLLIHRNVENFLQEIASTVREHSQWQSILNENLEDLVLTFVQVLIARKTTKKCSCEWWAAFLQSPDVMRKG